MLDGSIGEMASIAFEVAVVPLTNTNRSISKEGVFLMSGLGDVEIVVHGGKVEVSFNMTMGES